MKKYLLILLIALAGFLRLFNLGSIPPSASLDEASIAYNAYSVIKTGGDEFGDFPLISQRGYDDYRRSTYLLLTIPFIVVFNLTVIAERLPAAILSILTVWAIYAIAQNLFVKKTRYSDIFAFLTALILAINPWHIYISRLGHESNACLSFLVFGVYFFIKGRGRAIYFFVSALFLILSMISYYTGQILIPLLVLGALAIFYKELWKAAFKSRTSIIFTFLAGLLGLLVLFSIFSPEALIRYRGTSTLSADAHSERFATRVQLRNRAVEEGNFLGRIIYDRRLFYAQVLLEGYSSHFKPSWLFTNPNASAFKAPNSGLLYMWQIPFILMGIAGFVITKKIETRIKLLIFLWFFLGPLPASVATQAPHAMRAYNIVPVWALFTGFGILLFMHVFGRYKVIPLFLVTFVAVYGFMNFYRNYFIIFPKEQSKAYQYALYKTVPYILEHQDVYKKIVFSNEDNLYQSYMLFLYHSKYDPVLYQKEGGTVSGGYNMTHTFDKYEFRPIDWERENGQDTLFVGNRKDIGKNAKVLFEGNYLNNTMGVIVAEKIEVRESL